MTSVKAMLTYHDYVALPDDGRRYEILDGELNVTAAPNRAHQWVILRLAVALHAYVTSQRLGEIYTAPFDVILAETTIVQPDIIFVANERLTIFSDRGVDGAPTLAIEVLSPSTAHVDRGKKLQLYARYGIPYYWVVDAGRRSIDVYRLTQGAFGTPDAFSDELTSLPPFDELRLDPVSIWFP
jgi:Uma2 family endonuclease